MTELDGYILAEHEQLDVLIIGGGISGLIAAREIKKHEPDFKVGTFEESHYQTFSLLNF